jgi:hypothetical protein
MSTDCFNIGHQLVNFFIDYIVGGKLHKQVRRTYLCRNLIVIGQYTSRKNARGIWGEKDRQNSK